jgi:hypothetical protein
MAATVPIKSARTLIAAATSNAAAATTRGTVDLRSTFGGVLTVKLTNGSTGPTLQAEGRVLIAHNSGATPTAASAGVDWKTLFVFGGGTTANAVTEQTIAIDPAVMHLEVEVTANTGQAVVCEAFLSELTSPTT